MIAASEPQEFIPSGRQQVLRHPGRLHPSRANSGLAPEAFLSHRLQRVVISEKADTERWIVREAPQIPHSFSSADDARPLQETIREESSSWHSIDPSNVSRPNRLSEANVSKLPQMKAQFASNPELNRNETKSTSGVSNAQPQLPVFNDLNSKLAHFIEEELYTKGCTVVWSKGLISSPPSDFCDSESRITIGTYTMDTPVKHALWCTFHSTRPTFDTDEVAAKLDLPKSHSSNAQRKPVRCICIMDALTMRVFAENGEDFIANLQFPVAKIWKTKYGIILEKDLLPQESIFSKSKLYKCSSISDNSLPTIVSLEHPLDESCPILIRHVGSSSQIACDPLQKIVFTSEEPSLVMIYDTKTGLHSIFKLRRVRLSEYSEYTASMLKVSNATSMSMQSSMNASMKQKQNNCWVGAHVGIPLNAPSPFGSRPASMTSLISPQSSRTQSPMASISRCQSPCASPLQGNATWINRSRLQQAMLSPDLTSVPTRFESTTYTSRNASPELCLEHVWSENHGVSREIVLACGAASKVFLLRDLVGQMYICYLVTAFSQLCTAKVETTNNHKLIVGQVHEMRAKDAIPIPYLHLMAILEPNGQVVLRSGLTIIGKLHVGGVSVGLSASPYYASNAAATQLSSPFPRRSSLLPQFTTPAQEIKFNESAHLLSPVPQATMPMHLSSPHCYSVLMDGTHLSCLRDSVFDRLTLQYSDNVCYRLRLPPLAEGSLIRTCLAALRQALQKDLALILMCKWYATRNSPGPVDMTLQQEWTMFVNLLLGMFGYDIELLAWGEPFRRPQSPAPKRKRSSDLGDDSDWIDLLRSDTDSQLSDGISNLLCLTLNKSTRAKHISQKASPINTNANLFAYIPLVFYTLHLVYEELKLDMLRSNELQLMVTLLHQIASDLQLSPYVTHYWCDFPMVCSLEFTVDDSQINHSDLQKMTQLSLLEGEPPSIFGYLHSMMRGVTTPLYPYISHVNPRCKHIIHLTALILAHRRGLTVAPPPDTFVRLVVPPGCRAEQRDTAVPAGVNYNLIQMAVMYLAEEGFTRQEIENLPSSINLLLHEALWQCRENPPPTWPISVYQLLQRMDLATQHMNSTEVVSPTISDEKLRLYSEPGQEDLRCPYSFSQTMKNDVDDGMENIESAVLKLRFPKDRRVSEVRRLLQSASPVNVRVVQRPEVTDHDYIEEQEKHLYAICTRTMALPIGRGMFTLRTHLPVVTETLPIPRLCLNGKAAPRGNAVELTHIDTPANMNLWPLFHNGVAAGLRISPNASDIDSTWIVFNKPKGTHDTPTEHAGFLMALGLNGHLKNLAILNTYEYLIKINEMTSIGLLLGLSATKRGTLDMGTTKMLSIHVEALLPPTSMELDVPQNIQVAALLGVGLVYQESSHRHITEVLLAEIGRPPGPEMENSVDRESYSLAAGLALGLVTLGQGGKPSGLADLAVPDTLHYYMAGGNKRPLSGAQKDKYKIGSFQIREGASVNLDVTAPGATLALGLMYLGSGSQAIADWMRPPDTQYLLDFVRPDLLLLRIVSRALILWDDIKPIPEWVESQVPLAIRPFCLVKPEPDMDPNVDFEAMNQAYCNIIAGACFALGLRFAGSANEDAYQVLHHYCRMFVSLTAKSIAELAGKPTIETCLNLILLSLAMVMAGTGNLSVLRFVRHLRRRVTPASSSTVTYGAHLAMHMALGLLFLGGGRLTLSSSPPAVAAMLCAFFPKFPTHSNDNRYHLQAFRHLYVLAVEPRLIVPRDVIQGSECYTNIKITFLNGTTRHIQAPCILPELQTLQNILVDDERYWPVTFERERNWDQLIKLLNESGSLVVKQRAGCLSYIQDPTGTKSLLARTLSQSNLTPWNIHSADIASFSSDAMVKHCISQYLTPTKDASYINTNEKNLQELKLKQLLSTLMYDCVTKDKVVILPTWINIIKAIQNLNNINNSSLIWQLKLVSAQVLLNSPGKSLISTEFGVAISQQVANAVDAWLPDICNALKLYLRGESIPENNDVQNKLAKYVTFYGIPHKLQTSATNIIDLMLELDGNRFSIPTIQKLSEIINSNG